MYARQPPYRGMRIPQNYRGTAFPTEEETEKNTTNDIPELSENADMSPHPADADVDRRENSVENPSATVSSQPKNHVRSRLPFGLGIEDALILGLILLVLSGDTHDDLWIFLALLLFV